MRRPCHISIYFHHALPAPALDSDSYRIQKKNMQETALGFNLRTLEHSVSTCYEATRAKVGISTLKESLRGVLDEP